MVLHFTGKGLYQEVQNGDSHWGHGGAHTASAGLPSARPHTSSLFQLCHLGNGGAMELLGFLTVMTQFLNSLNRCF